MAQLMAVDSEEDDEDDEDDPDFDPLSKEDNSIQTSEMVSAPSWPISASPYWATPRTLSAAMRVNVTGSDPLATLWDVLSAGLLMDMMTLD